MARARLFDAVLQEFVLDEKMEYEDNERYQYGIFDDSFQHI